MLASPELGEADEDKRPSVQVGDPFTGKKLIEVSVELVERGLVESLQDCGAAGLASSLSEMAADYGIDVHLDRVPLREEGMEPWEIMISESQERMVAIVAPERLAEVEAVCERWELHHAVIGEVTDSGELARCLRRRDRRSDSRPVPDGGVPALRGRADAAAAAGGGRRCASSPPTREVLLELLASPSLRSRVVRLPPLRPARAVAHRAAAGARRCGAPAAAVIARPGALARRHRP